MTVRRIVPNLLSPSPSDSAAFYSEVLGFKVVMDHGWIVTVADPHQPQSQLSLMNADATAPVNPTASIQVTDVNAAYEAAVKAGAEIVYALTDEEWGVRRFFCVTRPAT